MVGAGFLFLPGAPSWASRDGSLKGIFTVNVVSVWGA